MADIRLYQNTALSSPVDADILFTANSASNPLWIESQTTMAQLATYMTGKLNINNLQGTPLTVANGGSGVTIFPKARAFANANQTITNALFTKIQLNAVTYNVNSNFDPTTNFRFLPTVAGYYSVYAQISLSVSGAGSTNDDVRLAIYKNGSSVSLNSTNYNTVNGGTLVVNIRDLISMNGTTDYLEIFLYQAIGQSNNIVGRTDTSYAIFSLSM